MNVIQYPALRYFDVTDGRRIDAIVMHHTAGVKAGDLWTLSGRDRRHKVSCHYYVTKLGEIFQLVRDQDIAWHAGVSALNGEPNVGRFSLGVEMENLGNGRDPYPQDQLNAVVWLARNKVQEYSVPRERLVRHLDVALPPGRKNDPRGFPWLWFLDRVYAPAAENIIAPDLFRVIWRTPLRRGPEVRDNIVEYIKPGDIVPGALVVGEVVKGKNQWIHRADGLGFVFAAATEPITVARP